MICAYRGYGKFLTGGAPRPSQSAPHRKFGWLPVALFSAALLGVGCGGSDQNAESGPPGQSGVTAAGLQCADGESDERTALFDLGENPRVYPSAREALDRFLAFNNRGSGVGELVETESTKTRSTFSLIENELVVAHVDVKRLDGGWIVIGYDYCRGTF